MLTTRETEVAQLIAKDKRNKEIADQLGISVETVKEHVHNITRKLKCKSRVGVAVWWEKGGTAAN